MIKTTVFRIADHRGIAFEDLAAALYVSPDRLLNIQRGHEPINAEFQRAAEVFFRDIPAELLFFDGAAAQFLALAPAYTAFDQYADSDDIIWSE